MKRKLLDRAQVERFSRMMAALGGPQRLWIMRLLLGAGAGGMTAGEIQAEMGVPASTLSHHLEKLKQEALIGARRQRTSLWYSADAASLRELLSFLYAECCTRNPVIPPEEIVLPAKRPRQERMKHR